MGDLSFICFKNKIIKVKGICFWFYMTDIFDEASAYNRVLLVLYRYICSQINLI